MSAARISRGILGATVFVAWIAFLGAAILILGPAFVGQ